MPYNQTLVPDNSRVDSSVTYGQGARAITPGAGDQLDPAGNYYKYIVAATSGDVTFVTYKGDDASPITMTCPAGYIIPHVRRVTVATGTVHGWFD